MKNHFKNNELFSSISHKNYIDVNMENVKPVVDFLKLRKYEVAAATQQKPASIRYDDKMPVELQQRLYEIGNIINLVIEYFDGDVEKAQLWFITSNPLLGNVSPREMVRFGKYKKLSRFIHDSLSGHMP